MRAEDWPSAAVVADNLMSLEQLTKYVDNIVPAYDYLNDIDTVYRIRYFAFINEKSEYIEKIAIRNRLRYLLARRLIRNNKLIQALAYIPVELRQFLKNLIYYSNRIDNTKLSNNERALSAYNAARIIRWHGMELLGTELWPDYQCLGGAFNYFSISPDWAKKRGLNEIANIAKNHAPKPNRRFHYRFKACNVMRKCLKLAEDDNLKLLANLAIGYWLYRKYPKEADP